MQFYILILICTIINQASSQENCSIVITSSETKKEYNETWTIGVNTILLSLQHRCNDYGRVNISWLDNNFDDVWAKTGNDNITVTEGNISETYHAAFNLTLASRATVTLTLRSSSMMESYLVVRYKNTEYTFHINITNCTYDKQRFSLNDTTKQRCPKESVCDPASTLFRSVDNTCGRHANWISLDCPEELNINMSEQNDLKNKAIPVGQKVKFLCENKTMIDASGRVISTTEYKIKFADHLNVYNCSERFNDSTTLNTNSIVFNVTSKPFSEHKKYILKSSGGSVFIKVPFKANPYVEKDKIKIKYKNTSFTDFSLSRKEISHELVLFFEQVSDNNTGEYQISLTGTDELCKSTTVIISVTLSKELHMGWIVSIVLGSLIFVIIVSISIYCIRYRRRNDSGKTNHKGMTNTNTKVNKPPAINMQPQHQGSTAVAAGAPALPERNNVSSGARQTQFQNPSNGYKSSDDEFDSDVSDYEKMAKNSGTIDNRPPMPLPPQQHGGRSPRHAPSGGHDNRNAGFPTQSQGPALPSPRNVPPPPPQNRGRMPPPARSAAAPLPPPPHQTRYPGGGGYGY